MRTSNKEAKEFFKIANTKFIDNTFIIEDHSLHYIQTGDNDNPTLLFVHGSPGSWDAYRDYLIDSLLLTKYRIISIDRPGFGYSDFGEAQNLKVQSRIINLFVKTIDNQKPVVLIGHSFGGPVVVKMASDSPNYYQQTIILAGALDPDAEKPEKWRWLIMNKPLRYFIPGAMRTANDELWWLKRDLSDLRSGLKKVTGNITIIHGTEDNLVPYSNVPFMEKEFYNAKSVNVITIKNGNHFIPWEHFELVRNTLYDLKF